MDLEFEGIRTDMQTDKIETEQNTHPQTRNMNEQHTPETAMNFVFSYYLIFLFLFCYAATQLALRLQQARTQVYVALFY